MSAVAVFNGSSPVGLEHHRGLHYGDGVFRTCLIYDSYIVDSAGQYEKITRDAAALGLVADGTALRREAQALAAGQSRGVLKLMLLRAGGQRGYRSAETRADRLLCRYPMPELPPSARTRGVRVFRSAFQLAAQPALAGIKHLNRLEQVLASRAWPEGADEGILGDDQGRPLSGTRSNLFWVTPEGLRTPRLDRCGVAGRMREKVLAAAQALGIPATIAPGSWTELEGAEEAFLTNSVIGIWPVAALDARRWDAPGPVTRRLMDHLRHPVLA